MKQAESSPRVRFLLLAAITVAAGVCLPLTAQDGGKPEKPDPEVAKELTQLKKALEDRKVDRDEEALGIIDGLLSRYSSLHKKDQGGFRAALDACLVSGRVKRPPERRGVFKAAAYALGEIGPDGSRSLVKAYNSSKYQPERDWVGLRADFLKALGRTKDVKQVEFLIDRAARDHEDEILRAAGIALGHFDEAKQKVRKNIVKELVKKLNEIFNKSRQSVDPGDPVMARAKYTLAAIERDWNQTLRKLTGQDFKTAPEWQRFYNKNKGKNWDR